MKRRSKLRILVDILRVAERGEANITQIMLEANLPYTRLSKYIDELLEKGLLLKTEDAREVKFKVTKKGREFLKEFERIERVAEAFGVEL